jgi:hypothetical protein
MVQRNGLVKGPGLVEVELVYVSGLTRERRGAFAYGPISRGRASLSANS